MNRIVLGLVLAAALAVVSEGEVAPAGLELSFLRPPDTSKPLTWWHWLNGSVTKAGITGDLEAMKRAGLGGCYLFNCGGKYPEGEARFMQPAWLELMDHTVREAERLGLTFGIHNCDGFSQSGGPWVTPETSMKELTWSAADAEGGKPFDARLAQPDMQEGFYRDIAVVAFPLPMGGPLTGAALRGTLPAAELKKLADGSDKTQAAFPVPADNHALDFVFDGPRVVRSLTVSHFAPHRWEEDFPMRLDVSDDGAAFCPVGAFTANWDFRQGGAATAAFADTTGRVFRVTFKNPLPVQIGEVALSGAAKAHFAEAKAGRLRSRGHGAETRHHRAYSGPDRNRPLAPNLVVDPASVCDLTSKMSADGTLKWDVPAGRWRILRIGFTSNGHYVSPATPEGRGLECDKLDPTAVGFHLDQYVGKLLERAGPAVGKTFAAVEIDSWECGIQNWTAGFERRFRERLGYDLLPYWPALLEGWIVGDADRTDRMLWDWRRFLANQFSACHFAVAADYLKAKGVTYVGESTGRQQYLYDVAYIRNSDVTMGEFWIDAGPGQGVRVDNKVASSIAHVAGRRIVASESYTSSPGAARWQNHPYSLKPEGDRAFCAGVNQFVFHTFAHQPYPATGPGFTFFYWGLNFNRGNTWWPAADAWMAYLTRCNFMLRQGQQVCDVLWFVGEDVPNRIAWRDELKPALPAGYDFDGCDVTALLEARVENGLIVLPSGASYRMLLLPDLPTMRPAVAKKVLDLAQAGAVIVAPRRPTQSPSLVDRGSGDDAVRSAIAALWDGSRGRSPSNAQAGNGGRASSRAVSQSPVTLFADAPFEKVFADLALAPDFETRKAAPDAEILYVHRRDGNADFYFLSNQQSRPESFEALFRISGKAPECWDPATSTITRPGLFRSEKDGRTCLPMRLDPNGSVFVVFREPAPTRHAVALEFPDPATAASAAPAPTSTLKEAKDTFTLALWVKPEADIPLPPERRELVALKNQNWAVHPPQGQIQFGDGHAGVGISAGRNGIVIFEHSARYAPAVLTYPANLSERTHVAVSYGAGVPTLYVNGREVKSGKKGPHIVHAAPGNDPAFRGERSAPQLFDRVLLTPEVMALANAGGLPPAESPVELERSADGKLSARISKNVSYTVAFSDKTERLIGQFHPTFPDPVTLDGPWQVTFPPNLGAPATASFDRLLSWPEHADAGIRFFSGTATYTKAFELPPALFGKDREITLDLGRVEVIAQVTLNGQTLPTLWKPPFRIRVDGVAKSGANTLEVRVTNLWPNRMIGDAALPDDIAWQSGGKGSSLPATWPEWLVKGQPRPSGRIAFCTRKDVYAKDDPLLPSGLLGPVGFSSAMRVDMN